MSQSTLGRVREEFATHPDTTFRPREIAKRLKIDQNYVGTCVQSLLKSGHITRVARGEYRHMAERATRPRTLYLIGPTDDQLLYRSTKGDLFVVSPATISAA